MGSPRPIATAQTKTGPMVSHRACLKFRTQPEDW